jgi:3-hydroxybutyryl-CoA dehydrogenase
LLERGLEAIRRRWAAALERGKLTAEARDQAAANLRGVTALEELAGCDLVIEAVTESLEEKRAVFRALDGVCGPEAILATNTSSIAVIELAMATARPERVCGLHFFNPVPSMKLVEVVRTVRTGPAVLEAAQAFVASLGKEAVAAKDRGGFLVNRLLVPYLLDAIRAVDAGLASIADVDRAMRLGCGHPMGPLSLADFIGLDTLCRIADILFEEYRESRYAPPPLLRRMVQAGLRGRKAGRGFYDYAGPEPIPGQLAL